MNASAPEPGRPEPTGAALSARERQVLDDLAGQENAGDPGFVLRMSGRVTPDTSSLPTPTRAEGGPAAPAPPATRRREQMLWGIVAGGLLAFLLPADWLVPVLMAGVLVVWPCLLVVRALRDGGLGQPRSQRPTDPPRTDPTGSDGP